MEKEIDKLIFRVFASNISDIKRRKLKHVISDFANSKQKLITVESDGVTVMDEPKCQTLPSAYVVTKDDADQKYKGDLVIWNKAEKITEHKHNRRLIEAINNLKTTYVDVSDGKIEYFELQLKECHKKYLWIKTDSKTLIKKYNSQKTELKQANDKLARQDEVIENIKLSMNKSDHESLYAIMSEITNLILSLETKEG